MRHLVPVLAVAVLAAACSKNHALRGTWERSPDGATRLVVEDDGGPGCVLHLDGKRWPHAPSTAGEVTPGLHALSCSAAEPGVGFDIAPGTKFHFEYWGP